MTARIATDRMDLATQGKPEPIGARIRRIRLEQGKSLRDVEGPGADHAHISRVESGHRSPTEPFLRTVARHLGVSVAYLRDDEEGSPADQRRAFLDDLELKLRLSGGDDRAAVVQQLRVLHAESVEVGDFPTACRCSILLGCSASDRGEHAVAVRELQRLVRAGQVSPQTEPNVYLSLGRSLAALGRADEAVELFEGCLADVEVNASTDHALLVRFSTYLSYALSDAGELRRARKVLEVALSRADGIEDRASRVRLFYSRARLAWVECDWEQGRSYAERAIALLDESEDVQDLIRMHLLRADIALLTGDVHEADRSIQEAEKRVSSDTDSQDIASLRQQQALIAARRHDSESAIPLAQEAIDLLEQDPASQGRAYWALAEALIKGDQEEKGFEMFRRAYELMSIERRFLPQLIQAWVEALREFGRFEDATDVFLDALKHGLFAAQTEPPAQRAAHRPLVAVQVRGRLG